MTDERLSMNKACIGAAAFWLVATVSLEAALYVLTHSPLVLCLCLVFSLLLLSCTAILLYLVRQKLTGFTNRLCTLLDNMLSGEMETPRIAQEETLFYKINHRLVRLYQIMVQNRRTIAKEQEELQTLISDISHQVKTPIANLKIITTTLLEQSVPLKKQQEFLMAMAGQVDKLDFLMAAMVKTSRLETGIIALKKKSGPIYNTLAAALGGVLLKAEDKHIFVQVSCPEDLFLSHDSKWTGEALFNILDNAVKYTPKDGSIHVQVQPWEMYVKIDISDTGKGIPEEHQGAIFQRFYREGDVHDCEGIGIGLYLAREIITMQGGYIKVSSHPGEGSTFSVFLPYQ